MNSNTNTPPEDDFEKLAAGALAYPELKLRWSAEWKTSVAIRESIETFFAKQGLSTREISKSPPEISGFSLSISHSPVGGVWAAVALPQKIGVDLEKQSRVTEPIVRRVSEDHEIQDSPEPSFLWSAKEAVFKSCWPENQGIPLSKAVIDSWQSIGQSQFRFTARWKGHPLLGRGWAAIRDESLCSVFLHI